MTEARGCFLLVSAGRPCVSLPTADGETRRAEREEEKKKDGENGEVER